jgi:hypothetical protein
MALIAKTWQLMVQNIAKYIRLSLQQFSNIKQEPKVEPDVQEQLKCLDIICNTTECTLRANFKAYEIFKKNK